MKGSQKRNPQAALRRLGRTYGEQVYLRSAPDRKAEPRTHRGYELRFIAHSAAERDELLSLLREAGETPGKPFATGGAWRIPVYGKEAVERLLAGMGVSPAAKRKGGVRRKK